MCPKGDLDLACLELVYLAHGQLGIIRWSSQSLLQRWEIPPVFDFMYIPSHFMLLIVIRVGKESQLHFNYS